MSLLDLFEGRRQLIVYRFFFEPGVSGWPDRPGCSMMADQVARLAHLNARDTTYAGVSRAPQPDIERLKARMGWNAPWYTLTDSFDADFGVDEWHGTNAFLRDGERVFRTYFVNHRGDEALGSPWSYLDLTALGRQEEWEDSLEGYPQTRAYEWWRRHDEYASETDPWEGRLDEKVARDQRARARLGRERNVTTIAHVGGVPVEELIPIAASADSVLLLARASLSLRLRRHRGAGHRDRRSARRSLEPCDRARLSRALQI